jgi:hypothetical protein
MSQGVRVATCGGTFIMCIIALETEIIHTRLSDNLGTLGLLC